MKMQKNRVYVTGFSAISSLGTDNKTTLESLSKEIPCIYMPGTGERYKYPYFKIPENLDKGDGLINNTSITLKLISSIEKNISGFSDIPVFLSTSTGGIKETEEIYGKFCDGNFTYPLFARHFFDSTANDIKSLYKNKFSDTFTFSTACSSSGHAIYQAYRFIKNGLLERAVIIGVDSLSLTTMIGFDSLKLVSHTGTKPLTKDRDGLSLGEGGGILLLEAHPENEPLCEITGCASNSDGYHISSPDPEGTSQKECALSAIADSGISADDIGYVATHGTGTLMNDDIEMKVLKSIFKKNVPVTSLKAFVGHTLGASAVLEIAIALLMLKNRKIYQPGNFQNPMDGMIPSRTTDADVCYFLKNSFGFGGNNVSIVLKNI
jgi:3-oxoacyl-[acyl-carrier-protein] synthase I